MPKYRIVLEMDGAWLSAIENFTNDVYDGEVLNWISVEEIN